MNRLALLLAVCFFPLLAPGQASPPKAPAGGIDKPAIEQYVRHLFVWGPQISVKVGDPKPSETLPGFREITVVASAGPASQDVVFFLSVDGKRLIQGNVYDLAKSPFET